MPLPVPETDRGTRQCSITGWATVSIVMGKAMMPSAPARQPSEKYFKRHHRCSSIHAEAPAPPSRGGVLRPGLYPDSVRREEVSAPVGKVSALSPPTAVDSGLAPEQGSSGQQSYSVNHRRTTPGMLPLRAQTFLHCDSGLPEKRQDCPRARCVRYRHRTQRDPRGSVQGPAPPTAEICYRIRKTKPSRCAGSAASYTISSPSFSYPGNDPRQKAGQDADWGRP